MWAAGCSGSAQGGQGDLVVLRYPGAGQFMAAAVQNVSEDSPRAPIFGYSWRGRLGWVRIPRVSLIWRQSRWLLLVTKYLVHFYYFHYLSEFTSGRIHHFITISHMGLLRSGVKAGGTWLPGLYLGCIISHLGLCHDHHSTNEDIEAHSHTAGEWQVQP